MKSLIKWLRILHRDLGYFAVGFTVIFSISGIAVNHMEDWNPNYSINSEQIAIDPPDEIDKVALYKNITRQLGIDEASIKNYYFATPVSLEIYTDDGTIYLNTETWKGRYEKVAKRTLFYDFNFIHLNKGKDSWKWISDLFAILLIFLALSGLFIVKGKKGFRWRGFVLMLAGLLLPFMYMIYYRM